MQGYDEKSIVAGDEGRGWRDLHATHVQFASRSTDSVSHKYSPAGILILMAIIEVCHPRWRK
jgi:hypothetical protein